MEKEIMEKLQAPFGADEIEWRVGSTNKEKTKGLALAYVTNRAIQNRLDEVFGCFGWQNEFKEWKGKSQICGISVWDVTKGIWITKWDGADDSQTEAVKGGLSDSMKRAAYQWGIGRYLYKLPQTWVALKDGKYLAEIPQLPQWALPEGYTYTKKPTTKPEVNNKPKSNIVDDILQCADCHTSITKGVHDVSVKYYGKQLCIACQKKNVKKEVS
jgi:hypothetical protein